MVGCALCWRERDKKLTNPVIENIRRSLGRSETTPLSRRPDIYSPRAAGSVVAETECFLDEVRKLSGITQRLTPEGIAFALQSLVTENNICKATLWHTSLLEQLGIANALRSFGVELISPTADKHQIALCDLGITDADFLLAETGTLVLGSSPEKPKAISLLPRIHLAIVRPDMLRPDMHQVFTEAKNRHYLLFITGPSRTADIELTVTLGVHGSKQLYVWMLSEE
jgi:L-lactate dehydrogenase complex protein LldG